MELIDLTYRELMALHAGLVTTDFAGLKREYSPKEKELLLKTFAAADLEFFLEMELQQQELESAKRGDYIKRGKSYS